MFRLLLLCFLAVPAHGQQDWQKLLDRVRDRVRQTIQRLPNYLCTETIDRTQYRPSSTHVPSCSELIAGRNERKLRPAVTDRLRVDVAVAKTGEMYSWVGESGFHDQSLGDLVKEGATSTGSFAAFLSAIFASGGVNFSFKREVTEGGRLLEELAYQVPQKASQYSFGYRTGRLLTGYSGTFLVDPKSADLVRLVIETDELPAYTESCQATTTLDYQRVVLHGSDFLLPSTGLLKIIDSNGVESENRTTFSACHEFLGESTLSFDDSPEPTPAVAAAQAVVARTPLAAGLPFRLALTTDIDMATAAVGDPVQAKLTSAIQDHSAKVLVPAGATLTGRIVELRHMYVPAQSWSIGLRLETLKSEKNSRPFLAGVDLLGQKLSGSRGNKGTLHWRSAPGVVQIEFADLKPGEAIRGGQEMKWVTVWPPATAPKVETSTAPPAQANPVPAQFRLEDPAPDSGAANRPGWAPAGAVAPTAPQNLRFEDGLAGDVPSGWQVPGRADRAAAEVRSEGCKIGPRCAFVQAPNSTANSFENLMQSFDAGPYRGKTIRLHAWIREDSADRGNRAQMWLRVDRQNGEIGFFDNSQHRPVTSEEWKECEIKGRIDNDARTINIGVMAFGRGGAWIDGIEFEIAPPPGK